MLQAELGKLISLGKFKSAAFISRSPRLSKSIRGPPPRSQLTPCRASTRSYINQRVISSVVFLPRKLSLNPIQTPAFTIHSLPSNTPAPFVLYTHYQNIERFQNPYNIPITGKMAYREVSEHLEGGTRLRF